MPKLSAKDAARFSPTATHAQRKDRVVRLRDELNAQLDIICFSRESLQKEVTESDDPHGTATSTEFLKKLGEMTKGFNALTAARIQLLKAERAAEEDLTPAEEQTTVVGFVRSLDAGVRGTLIEWLIDQYQQDHPTLVRNWGKGRAV